MTRNQAVEAMMNGRDTKGEYLFINNDGLFETEDGHTHGNSHGEFWTLSQKWPTDWYLVK